MKQNITAAVRSLIIERLETSSPLEISRIVGALAANDQIEAAGQVAALSTPRGIAASTADASRFVTLNDDGKPVVNGAWVFDRTTGLVWGREVIPGEFNHADAMKACEKVKFRGVACRAPTLAERFSINDYAKHSPALDTALFAKESGWEWTSTIDAESPSGDAWGVYLGGGFCSRYGVSFRDHVRAVLAGQQLNLSV